MYLLIGATSFIGAYVVEEFLSSGIDIVVTGRNKRGRGYYAGKQIAYIDFDLGVPEDIGKLPTENVDGVIVCAGMLPANSNADLVIQDDAARYFDLNVLATIRILEYCRANGINRVLQFSSYADVQNSWSADKALSESEPRSYRYSGDHAAYVFSKNAMTDLLEYYNSQYQMRNIVFRLPPVIGVGPHGAYNVNGKPKQSGFQCFIEKACAGDPIVVFGDREITRDIVYVKDVAKAVKQAMLSDESAGLYNMTSGKGVGLLEQAAIIAEVFAPAQGEASVVCRDASVANEASSFLFSVEKAKRDFGYAPEYTDFREMMTDYKRDLDGNLFKDLFAY